MRSFLGSISSSFIPKMNKRSRPDDNGGFACEKSVVVKRGGGRGRGGMSRLARALSIARWCLDPEKGATGRACDRRRHGLLRRATLPALACFMHPAKAELMVTALTRGVSSYAAFHEQLARVVHGGIRRKRERRRRKMKENRLRRRGVRDEARAAAMDDDGGEAEEDSDLDGDLDAEGMSGGGSESGIEDDDDDDDNDEDATFRKPAPLPPAAAAADDDKDADSDSDDVMIVEEVSSEAAALARSNQSSNPAAPSPLSRPNRASGGGGGPFPRGDEGIAVAAEALDLRLKGERGYGNCMFCAASSGFNSWLDPKRTLDRAASSAAASAFGFESIIGWADLR